MKIIKLLLGFSIISVALYFAYINKIDETIIDTYHQLSKTGEANPGLAAKPESRPTYTKAQVDLLIQQQYQKTLSQASDEDELSDSEKLQMLEEALHELNSGEDEYDRELAVMTLGELKSAEAKQGMVTALHDESELVVSQAIRQIDKWQDSAERTEMLLIALQSNNDDMLEQTLLSISVVEDKKLIARLKQLAKHDNRDIREAAQMTLNLAP